MKAKKKSIVISRRSARRSTRATRLKKRGHSFASTVTKLPLNKYQLTGVKWLMQQPYAGLFLDPGLGKTLTVLVAFLLLKEAGLVDWMLVVAPLRPCYMVWPEEVTKWGLPFKTSIIHGANKQEALEADADIYICTYEGVSWVHDKMESLQSRGVGWLVADESTKIKHLKSLRHAYMDAIIPCFGRRTILTGTPIPNGYVDLFGQLKVLDQGKRLGLYFADYKHRWFDQSGYMGRRYVPRGRKAEKEIEQAIRDVCLRFSDKDLGLRKWQSHNIEIELPKYAREVYKRMEHTMVAQLIQGTVSANNPGVLTSKLRQIASGGVYLENDELGGERKTELIHDVKTDAVEDLLDELNGKQLLVAYEFEHDLGRLKKRFGEDTPHIGGKVSPKKSLEIARRFNAGEIPILLAQEGALALGLNMQKACHHVVWYTITWNLENYIQFIKRVHRQGQKHLVHVYHIIARDSVDERVMEVINGKDKTQKALLDGLRRYHLGYKRKATQGARRVHLRGRVHGRSSKTFRHTGTLRGRAVRS